MTSPPVHHSLRGVARTLPNISYSARTLAAGRVLLRHVLATRAVPGVDVEDALLCGARVRLYTPRQRNASGAILWFHGGGLVSGHPAQVEHRCSLWARDLGVVVASAHYRLAPEHPYPAALEDCVAAWDALQTLAPKLDIDPRRVVVGGDSAGGGLAACLTQRLVDTDASLPAGQLLVYPMLDDRTAADRSLDALAHLVWSNRSNRFGWASYLGVEPGGAEVPDHAVAGRRDDFSGFPPTWIGVGTADLFHAENVTYAERLRAAGTDVTFESVPGGFHGFDVAAPRSPLARSFAASKIRFLGRHIF